MRAAVPQDAAATPRGAARPVCPGLPAAHRAYPCTRKAVA